MRRLALASLIALLPAIASAQMALIAPDAPNGDSTDRIANTKFVQNAVAGGGSLALASGKIFIGSAGNLATAQTMSGDGTLSIAGALTLATVNSNTGPFGSGTQCVTVTNNAKGLTTAVSATACTPPISSVTGLGTGVATALGIAANGSGGFISGLTIGTTTITSGTTTKVLFDNAGVVGEYTISGSGNVAMTTSPAFTTPNLGTPSAATLTSATGLPISTGLTGAGTGVLAALAVNTGTAGSHIVNGGVLGTPSSGTATNLTGTASGLTAGTVTTNANLTGDVTSVGNATTYNNTVPTSKGGIGSGNGAWGTWTPTLACTTGTPTTFTSSELEVTQIARLVKLHLKITATDIGTCTGQITFSLPVTATGTQYIGSGFNPASGSALVVRAGAVDTTHASVYAYNGGFPAANTQILFLDLVYQAAASN